MLSVAWSLRIPCQTSVLLSLAQNTKQSQKLDTTLFTFCQLAVLKCFIVTFMNYLWNFKEILLCDMLRTSCAIILSLFYALLWNNDTAPDSVLEVPLNDMRYITSCFTYLLTYIVRGILSNLYSRWQACLSFVIFAVWCHAKRVFAVAVLPSVLSCVQHDLVLYQNSLTYHVLHVT